MLVEVHHVIDREPVGVHLAGPPPPHRGGLCGLTETPVEVLRGTGTAPESAVIFTAFTSAMDATDRWDVAVPTPLGRLHFDVRIRGDGGVTASYRGRPIPVPAMRTTPEGDGLRVRWTQRLTFPVRVEIGVDALVIGDRLTGTATAGPRMPLMRLEGRRIA